jgi:transposase
MKRVTEQVTKMVEAVRQARITGQVLVKIGIDAHLSTLVIAEQTEEQAPKPPRKLSSEALLKVIAAHRHAGKTVVTCYEAGPLGFGLHEQLEAAGAHNLVVRPRALQQYGCPLKTDRRDAQQLTSNLDRFVAGNTQALAPVAIPDEQERIRRTHGRQREHLSRQRRRELQQARGVALFHGYPLRGDWWRPRRWSTLRLTLPAFLQELIAATLERVALLDHQLAAAEEALTTAMPVERPKGLGSLTAALIEREVVDWHRFRNRRQIASFTGLVPGEHSSGQSRLQGSITKHGNRRLRTMLVECAWRLLLYQRGYIALKKWGAALTDATTSRARRKKLLVALARQWAVDLWRWRTGRVTLARLGVVPA